VTLRRLDLSHNSIKQIGANLSSLTGLEWLDLRGNAISNMSDLNELRPLTALTTLLFQDSTGENSNPICKNPAYSVITVTQVLPQLTTLDGGHVAIAKAFNETLLQESPRKTEKDTEPLPVDMWFSASDYVDDERPEDATSNKNLINGLQRTSEMLSIDCTHLLRKFDSAINRAKTSLESS
jgi:Leucine rich repeat